MSSLLRMKRYHRTHPLEACGNPLEYLQFSICLQPAWPISFQTNSLSTTKPYSTSFLIGSRKFEWGESWGPPLKSYINPSPSMSLINTCGLNSSKDVIICRETSTQKLKSVLRLPLWTQFFHAMSCTLHFVVIVKPVFPSISSSLHQTFSF